MVRPEAGNKRSWNYQRCAERGRRNQRGYPLAREEDHKFKQKPTYTRRRRSIVVAAKARRLRLAGSGTFTPKA